MVFITFSAVPCELSHVSITLSNPRKINIFESVNVVGRTSTGSAFTAVLKMQKQSDFIANGLPPAWLQSARLFEKPCYNG